MHKYKYKNKYKNKYKYKYKYKYKNKYKYKYTEHFLTGLTSVNAGTNFLEKNHKITIKSRKSEKTICIKEGE